MELIGSIIGVVCAFFSGFFGHIAAHDFCGAAPRLSERLVLRAVALLPKSVRDRYREEWFADLNDREGVIDKFTWALGIVWCARGIAQREADAALERIVFVLEAPDGTVVEADFVTCSLSIAVINGYLRYRMLIAPLARRLIARAGCREAYRNWHIGIPDFEKADQVINFLRENDPHSVKLKIFDDGRLIKEGNLMKPH